MAVRDKNAKFKLPNPKGGNGKDLAPFLKSQDLPNKPIKAEITGNARVGSSRFGDGVILDVKIGKKTYALFLKFTSKKTTQKLFERFGKDVSKWRGTCELERGNHLGKDYVKLL